MPTLHTQASQWTLASQKPSTTPKAELLATWALSLVGMLVTLRCSQHLYHPEELLPRHLQRPSTAQLATRDSRVAVILLAMRESTQAFVPMLVTGPAVESSSFNGLP